MKGFYNVLETIKTELLGSPFCNTVTYGDIRDVDLAKKTAFPLSHFIVDSAQYGENIITFSINLLCMDLVDISKEDTADQFTGNDNEQDVLNTQLQVVVKLLDELKLGTLYTNLYQLTNDPSIEPFTKRFDNLMAGWAVNLVIEVQNDNSIC